MKFIHWASIGLAVLTLIITIVFFSWWSMKEPIVFGGDKFNQQKWMQAKATIDNDCKRGDMAYHLKENILIRGAHRDAVNALLGRPSYEDDTIIEYDLGKCMHVYHGLRIYFDANNHLLHSKITSH